MLPVSLAWMYRLESLFSLLCYFFVFFVRKAQSFKTNETTLGKNSIQRRNDRLTACRLSNRYSFSDSNKQTASDCSKKRLIYHHLSYFCEQQWRLSTEQRRILVVQYTVVYGNVPQSRLSCRRHVAGTFACYACLNVCCIIWTCPAAPWWRAWTCMPQAIKLSMRQLLCLPRRRRPSHTRRYAVRCEATSCCSRG